MIDAHTHLDDDRLFAYADKITGDFEADGIELIIDGSSNFDTMIRGVELAEKYQRVYTTIGVHPNDAETFDEKTINKMRELSSHEKVVAVGEIGLDYYYDTPSREVQKEVFAEQLKMADEFKLPVVLHIRDAYADAFDVLSQNKCYLNNGVVLHCYSGSLEMAKRFSEFDCYFCFGGAITFKNAKKEDIIRSIPLNRLLTETDAPYMTPHPFRGQTNYPKYIKYTYMKMADALGITSEELEKIIRQNTLTVFKRIKL